ncbi:hypothetical protein QQ045_005633 [Rhodiola kirilowii]
MRDKFTTFIMKNPPEQKKGSKDKKAMRRAEKERLKEGEAADEVQKKLKKEAAKKKATTKSSSSKKTVSASDEEHSSGGGSQGDENEVAAVVSAVADEYDDDDVQWQTDTSFEAAKKRMQEQLSSATAEMIRSRVQRSLQTEENPNGTATDNVKGDGNGACGPHERLVTEIKKRLNDGESVSQLKSYMSYVTDTIQEKMNALFVALFDGAGKGFAKNVMERKKYLIADVAA